MPRYARPASPQKEYGYRNGQLLITAEAAARTNVARASNGGVVSYSSQESPYVGSLANDGEHLGYVSGQYTFWRDNTNASYPDWLQVDFNGSKSIDEIDLYTVQDNAESPSEPTTSTTFSLYGITDFDVQYWNPDTSGWTTVTGGNVTSNNKVWKKLNFTAVTTTKIRVTINNALASRSRIVELEAWGTAVTTTAAVNVAAAANGATATAQNYTQDGVMPGLHFQPSYANDSTRYIHGPSGDLFWRDEHGLSSWLQIDFNGSKTINEVDVYTIDGSLTQSDPTATQTFTSLGASAYDVQYWTGSAWATISGGSITSNNLVWKKLSFTAITTTKIRVVVNAASDSVARLAEVEAWTPATSSASANINWLVSDQLGTPRMVFDQSGSLATTKRHDYAPFGEELFNGARSTALGYGTGDTTRQKFTSKERDFETGLDYFLARYYSSTQGRFTSVDPHNAGAYPDYPQSWNAYTYARNNPLLYVDPDGLDIKIVWDGEKNTIWYSERQFGNDKRDLESQGFIVKGVKILAPVYDDDGNPIGVRQIGTYASDMNDLGQGVSAELSRRNPAFQTFGKVGLLYMSFFTLPASEGPAFVGWLSKSLTTAEVATPAGAAAATALIQNAGVLTTLRNGVQQGFVHGNPQQIFNALAEGGTKLPSGAVRLADGTFVNLYKASSTGEATIWIQRGAQQFKMRVIP